jgi:hypothetical protein
MSSQLELNDMFSKRETVDEAMQFAVDLCLAIEDDNGSRIVALTAVHVVYNTMAERINKAEFESL